MLPPGVPVVDHHAHLSPKGEGVEAARRFHREGGTHLFLATQNYEPSVPMDLDAYRRQFDTTEQLAERIRREVEVTVYSVLAPYPVDLVRQVPALGSEAAAELQERALELAGDRVKERAAVALGEVGRPHFAVPSEVSRTAERVFRRALEVARDVGAPVVIHCEDLTADGYRGLAAVATSVSFPVHRLVKHYARSVVPEAERAHVVPSYVARRELIRDARTDHGPAFLETDFLDDPSRPGAVLDLATVPRRAHAMAAEGPAGVEALHRFFVDPFPGVYGFTPEVRAVGAA